ncbi:MAG: hypothetical protein QG580_417 [Patescibacteria group bacterium]|nr:hypothetical protein [Patescibacteria group bacterium]
MFLSVAFMSPWPCEALSLSDIVDYGRWAISLVAEQRSPKPLAGVRFFHRPQ